MRLPMKARRMIWKTLARNLAGTTDAPSPAADAAPSQAPAALPPTVTPYVFPDGRKLYLLGTAHVSRQSVDDVKTCVAALHPDVIGIELCQPRYEGFRNPDRWKQTNLFQVIRQGKALFLLAQLLLQSFYRRLGDQLETEPGAEMMEGARQADATGARLELIDRRIDLTLKRTWRHLSFLQKCRMAWMLISSLFASDDISAEDVEALKSRDQMDSMMGAMGEQFPAVKRVLIDERDMYLAERLRRLPPESSRVILAVVGAGHVPGIVRNLGETRDLTALEALPPPTAWARLWPWLLPAAVVALVAWGFWQGGAERAIDSMAVWCAVNAACAALGCLLALPHPLTLLVAALAAPITSLNPTIAAGWVAGLAEVWLRPPAVKDFESLPADMLGFRSFVRNPVMRILLVVVLTNLGSTVGTLVAIPWIASLTAAAP